MKKVIIAAIAALSLSLAQAEDHEILVYCKTRTKLPQLAKSLDVELSKPKLFQLQVCKQDLFITILPNKQANIDLFDGGNRVSHANVKISTKGKFHTNPTSSIFVEGNKLSFGVTK